MKKAYKLILALIMCLSLSGCCGSTGFIAGTTYTCYTGLMKVNNKYGELHFEKTYDGAYTIEDKKKYNNITADILKNIGYLGYNKTEKVNGLTVLSEEVSWAGAEPYLFKLYKYNLKYKDGSTFEMYGAYDYNIGDIVDITYGIKYGEKIVLESKTVGKDETLYDEYEHKMSSTDKDLDSICRLNNLSAPDIDYWNLCLITDKSDEKTVEKSLFDEPLYKYNLDIINTDMEIEQTEEGYGPDNLEVGKYYMVIGNEIKDSGVYAICGYTDVDEKVREFLK